MSLEFQKCQSHVFVGMAIQSIVVAGLWQTGIINPLQQVVAATIFLGLAFLHYPRSQSNA